MFHQYECKLDCLICQMYIIILSILSAFGMPHTLNISFIDTPLVYAFFFFSVLCVFYKSSLTFNLLFSWEDFVYVYLFTRSLLSHNIFPKRFTLLYAKAVVHFIKIHTVFLTLHHRPTVVLLKPYCWISIHHHEWSHLFLQKRAAEETKDNYSCRWAVMSFCFANRIVNVTSI